MGKVDEVPFVLFSALLLILGYQAVEADELFLCYFWVLIIHLCALPCWVI